MKVRAIRSVWMERDGRRLDCGPYMSGALEARDALDRLHARKERLQDVTLGGLAGIFHSGREKRLWVTSPDHGIPFLGSSDILQADLSRLALISKKIVLRNPSLLLQSRWTLITRSGTIGRMAYARPDMVGLACSEDVLRVVPDSDKIPPGYLYAFLSSKYGVPLVVSGTYGAIIQHIEPEHIADLPVPRFGASIEGHAHRLVEKAANDLSKFSARIQSATQLLLSHLGLEDVRDSDWLADRSAMGWGETELSSESLRALNYDPRARRIRNALGVAKTDPLGALCVPEFFRGKNVFTRIDASPEHGVMLLGQRNAFHLFPDGRWISAKSVMRHGLRVPPGTTMIPSHGTLGEFELYCRALLVTRRMSRHAFSGDFFRCVPVEGRIRAGYLFAFLRSRMAFRLLRSISTGGKQQEQHPAMMWRLPIPRLDSAQENEIADLVDEAAALYDAGLDAEEAARKQVELSMAGDR